MSGSCRSRAQCCHSALSGDRLRRSRLQRRLHEDTHHQAPCRHGATRKWLLYFLTEIIDTRVYYDEYYCYYYYYGMAWFFLTVLWTTRDKWPTEAMSGRH